MVRTLSYLAWTLVFLASLIAGCVFSVDGAINVMVFLAWVNIVLGFCSRNKECREVIRKKGRPVPEWLYQLIGLGETLLLVWFGYFWTAGFFLVALAQCNAAYESQEAAAG